MEKQHDQGQIIRLPRQGKTHCRLMEVLTDKKERSETLTKVIRHINHELGDPGGEAA